MIVGVPSFILMAVSGWGYVPLAVLAVIGTIYFVAAGLVLSFFPNSPLGRAIRSDPPAALGVPMAALGAFAVVALLEAASTQPLKAKGLGFEFEGPACQAVLWIFCTLALALCYRLMRRGG